MGVVFLGPPGAGKGTHAKILSERRAMEHLATGDLLRVHVQRSTALGKQAKSYMDSGKLVPDDVVIEMIRERLASLEGKKSFLLDGFPRTVEQAKALERMLVTMGVGLDAVFDFEVSDAMILERLSGRRVCLDCGASYHMRNIPPKKEGICDHCGARLIQRKDDAPDTVTKRLQVYRRETAPLIDYYRRLGLLRKLDGDLGLEPVQEALALALPKAGENEFSRSK
jgi:adenylate kinase